MGTYAEFLARKAQMGGMGGFESLWMPDSLFPFQRELVDWAVRMGRCAVFADCGLGKTPDATHMGGERAEAHRPAGTDCYAAGRVVPD